MSEASKTPAKVPALIFDELDRIADIAVCAAMATHAFDRHDADESCALRALCREIASRLRSLQGIEPTA